MAKTKLTDVVLSFPEIGSHIAAVDIPDDLLGMSLEVAGKVSTDLYLFIDENLYSLYDVGCEENSLWVSFGKLEEHLRECDWVCLRQSGHLFHRLGNGSPVLEFRTWKPS